MPMTFAPSWSVKYFALIAITAMSLSACTTVDVTSFGTETAKADIAEQDKGNIISRTVSTMKKRFVKEGWCEDQSRHEVQSATAVLIDGLKPSNSNLTNVSVSTPSVDFVDDMKTASQYVQQTAKAAEIYLNVSTPQTPLTEELNLLQSALNVSEQAYSRFEMQSDDMNRGHVELAALKSDVEGLRLVADRFGQVVRTQRLAKLSQSAS